jgi:hypothetical protein
LPTHDISSALSASRLACISAITSVAKLATVIADLTDWGALASPDSVADGAPDLLTRLLILSDMAGGAFLVTGIAKGRAVSRPKTATEEPTIIH